MNIQRKVDLSIFYWLQALFVGKATVVDGYPVDVHGVPTDEVIIPTVASERTPTEMIPLQLGGGSKFYFSYFCTVYAKTKAQRDDMAYTILEELDTGNIKVYDYDMGFPPAVPSGIGCLVPIDDASYEVLYTFPDGGNQTMNWRGIVAFRGYFTN